MSAELVSNGVLNLFETLASNSTITNTTHESLASTFPQYSQNVGSIVVSCVFISCYAIVVAIMSGILIRYRKEMKRNQILVFFLVFWCIGQQTLALIFRLAYNGRALWINLTYSDYTKIENFNQLLIPLYVFSAIESVAVYLQGAVIIVIICFILNIFLDTARVVNAMTQKAHKFIKYFFNIISTLFAVLIFLLAFVHVGVVLASKVATNFKANVIAILIVIFVIFAVTITIESIMFVFVGVRLILFVRKNSLGISQASSNFLQRPEVKIGALIVGMLISAYFQLLASIVAIITTSFNPVLHVIDYSLQALGILLFSIFVLLVYNPLVSYNMMNNKKDGKVIGNTTSEMKSERSTNNSKRSKGLSQIPNSPKSPVVDIALADCVSPSATTTTSVDQSVEEDK
ncbi:predicted protein [Naegleria gruberi]|uniref:Predicted protein n=1 Tax=Naegleria gruberi TaxID=5762 RepID=D2V8X0_NAEGR|nr:uncharacterized protein NAEGRDRAFT_65312 [Naegleria gruberi]EFC46765.1 predicted protein [Naegleria gruberi]|eukprot:XP_002679509.1 predicted protein [Naegleria gruberi strain NEG-M]